MKIELGTKIEKLTPIKKIRIGKNYKYLCICECGTEKEIYSWKLKIGRTKSCGCTRKNSRVGERFGLLVALEKLVIEKQTYYRCLCDCGKIKDVRLINLLSKNKNKSCGCFKYRDPDDLLFNRFLTTYRYGAKIRNQEFLLTKEEFKELISKACFYCGNFRKTDRRSKLKGRKVNFSGIDRIDNNKGYTVENCVPCCFTCNAGKSNLSVEEFRSWTTEVYNHWASAKIGL